MSATEYIFRLLRGWGRRSKKGDREQSRLDSSEVVKPVVISSTPDKTPTHKRFMKDSPRKKQPPQIVTLGIDYGTSQTKVMFRAFGKKKSMIIPPPDSDALTWPSVVNIKNNQFRFAQPDNESTESVTIRWLKIRLSESVESPESRSIAEEHGCSIECLSCLYLAYIIHNSTNTIREYLGPCDFNYHLSIPLADDVENEIAQRFRRALFWAVRLTSEMQDNWSLEEARRAYKDVCNSNPNFPDDSERNTFILPEVHAAMVGLIRGRMLASGHYAVVDIGAGTTDISVFLYHESIQDYEICINGQNSYFSAGVLHTASNAVDESIANGIRSDSIRLQFAIPNKDELLSQIRVAKETIENGELNLKCGVSLPEHHVNKSALRICSQLHKHYREVAGKAYQKEMRAENWKDLTVIMLGGGSLFKPFWKTFSEKPMTSISTKIDQIRKEFPDGLHVLRQNRIEEVTGMDYMFTVAEGLTEHIARIPKAVPPPEIIPIEPRKPREKLSRTDKDCD